MSTKRKLDTNAVVADASDAIKESENESPKHDKSEENEENQPSKKRKLNNKSENESNSAFGASKGFALTDFTFSNEASNTGFTGLGFGSNTSNNDGTNNKNGFFGFGSFGTFGGMSGTCGFGFGGNNDENKSNDKKDETNNCATKDENGATNSISAWSTNATETKKWTFGDTSSFSFGNDKNSSFGNFGGFDSGFKSGFGNFNKGDNNEDGNDDGNDDNNDKNEQSSNKEENDSEYGNFNKNVAKCEMTGERDGKSNENDENEEMKHDLSLYENDVVVMTMVENNMHDRLVLLLSGSPYFLDSVVSNHVATALISKHFKVKDKLDDTLDDEADDEDIGEICHYVHFYLAGPALSRAHLVKSLPYDAGEQSNFAKPAFAGIHLQNESSSASKLIRKEFFRKMFENDDNILIYDKNDYTSINLTPPATSKVLTKRYHNNVYIGKPDMIICLTSNVDLKMNENKEEMKGQMHNGANSDDLSKHISNVSSNHSSNDSSNESTEDNKNDENGPSDRLKRLHAMTDFKNGKKCEIDEKLESLSSSKQDKYRRMQFIANTGTIFFQFKFSKKSDTVSDGSSVSDGSVNTDDQCQAIGYYLGLAVFVKHKKPLLGCVTTMNDKDHCALIYYTNQHAAVLAKECTPQFMMIVSQCAAKNQIDLIRENYLPGFDVYPYQGIAKTQLRLWMLKLAPNKPLKPFEKVLEWIRHRDMYSVQTADNGDRDLS